MLSRNSLGEFYCQFRIFRKHKGTVTQTVFPFAVTLRFRDSVTVTRRWNSKICNVAALSSSEARRASMRVRALKPVVVWLLGLTTLLVVLCLQNVAGQLHTFFFVKTVLSECHIVEETLPAKSLLAI